MSDAVDHIVTAIFNLAVLGGTAYLVGWHDWSGWWFLLAIVCLGRSGRRA